MNHKQLAGGLLCTYRIEWGCRAPGIAKGRPGARRASRAFAWTAGVCEVLVPRCADQKRSERRVEMVGFAPSPRAVSLRVAVAISNLSDQLWYSRKHKQG